MKREASRKFQQNAPDTRAMTRDKAEQAEKLLFQEKWEHSLDGTITKFPDRLTGS